MKTDLTSITNIAGQLHTHLKEFIGVLAQETELLKKANLEPLLDILNKKSTLSTLLENTFSEFSQTLPPSAPALLDQLIKSDEFSLWPSTLQHLISDIIELTNTCHDQNLANGMTVQILNNVNQTSLNLLTGQQPTNVYGSLGKKTQQKNKKTLGTA